MIPAARTAESLDMNPAAMYWEGSNPGSALCVKPKASVLMLGNHDILAEFTWLNTDTCIPDIYIWDDAKIRQLWRMGYPQNRLLLTTILPEPQYASVPVKNNRNVYHLLVWHFIIVFSSIFMAQALALVPTLDWLLWIREIYMPTLTEANTLFLKICNI